MKLLGTITVDFDVNRSTTDQIFCIRQILEKKWDYSEIVHQLFIDFKKAYDSVRREVLYNILIESGGTHEISQADKNCVYMKHTANSAPGPQMAELVVTRKWKRTG
jgi:hypothetical protein